MSKLPTPKSREQILGEMLNTYMSRIGVNDLNTGGAMVSMFEAVAQAIARASGDTFTILRDNSVDRAEGEALKRIAQEENINIIPARVSTGLVTIGDSSFEKISTKIYAGTPPPNIGVLTVNVSDASKFPSSGNVFIGRGTNNIEGPIPYSSITQVGGFYQLNLAGPTTKYHNINENVILAQGGVRTIPTSTVVQTVASGSTAPITFTTSKTVTLLSGENEITSVPVAAQEPGGQGNITKNSVREFVSSPFSGATVTNPNPFTTGRNEQTDEELRVAIKRARLSRGLGTAVAIKNAIDNAQASDENTALTSSEIISDGEKTTLYIDNGEGYEEKVNGVGYEVLVDSALGGEQYFQLATGGVQSGVAKAFLKSFNVAPYAINPNDKLSLLVGDVLSEHIFSEGNFRSNGNATAYEVVSSINSNSDLLFEAGTVDNGTKLIITARSEDNEFLKVIPPSIGVDSSIALGLSDREITTLYVYRNDQLLSRNGRSALIESANQSDWSSIMATGETLILSVDHTSPITYTFTDDDFAAEGTYTTLASSNSLQSWVNVINSKVVGVTASVNGNLIAIYSNLGRTSRASLDIDVSSTLVSKGMFSSTLGLSSQGKASDYTFSTNTAQLRLSLPLDQGDKLTLGSEKTYAAISSREIVGGIISLIGESKIWFLIDEVFESVTHNVSDNSIVHLTKETNNRLRFRSNIDNSFANVQVGDYVILWSDSVSSANRLEGRVYSKGSSHTLTDNYFEIRLTANEYAAAVQENDITFSGGLSFVRTDGVPQIFRLSAGSYNINILAQNLEDQISGIKTSVLDNEILTINSNNNESGSVLVVTQNAYSSGIGLTVGDYGLSSIPHFGTTINDLKQLPLFIHSTFASDRNADPSNSYIADFQSSIDLEAANVEPNVIVNAQHPYLHSGVNIQDTQAVDQGVQIDDISSTLVDIDDSNTWKRIRVNDRYYLLNTLDFGYNDSITLILDNNSSEKTFPINLYRRGITNATKPIDSDQFRAYDLDAGSTVEFSNFFDDFDFKNYKVLMRARNVIDPVGNVDEDAILFRSSQWGRAGNMYDVGYKYPVSANQSIAHTINVKDKVRIRLSLKSGDPVVTTIDGTTEWDVSITPNSPVAGVDTVTYAHSGGTAPSLAALVPDNYVTISGNGEFVAGNRGTFKIISCDASSFTVYSANGVAQLQLGAATLTTNTIMFYEHDDTTASEIVDYVTDNLSNWLLAELIDDNGDSGSGIINASTYENSDYSYDSINLVDGINWIKTSDLTSVSPDAQFEFKNILELDSFDTNTSDAYAFNNGEEFRLIPTTISQLESFLSVLAVTGVTISGNVQSVDNGSALQLSTKELGSGGAVTVSGGNGNLSESEILGSSSVVNSSNLLKINTLTSTSTSLDVGSWVKLSANNKQNKLTGISFTTQAEITPNLPTPNQSIIELSNRDITDRYFGQPRNHFRDRERAFQVEKQGSLVCISWDNATGGDPVFSKIVNINDSGGGQASVSYDNDHSVTEYTITSGNVNFNEVSMDDIVVIQNFSNSENNGTFKVLGVSDDGKTISVNNPNGVSAGAAGFSATDFVVSTEIQEGDLVTISSPFDTLNRGQFRVIRRYNNSFYIDNPIVVEERVEVGSTLKDLNITFSDTAFDVTVPGNMRIEHSGGSAPDFSEVRMGDVVTVGTAFNANNQGSFMVVDSGDDYMELANANAVAQSGVTISGIIGSTIEAHVSALVFSPYENTVVGDSFIISGNVLEENNQGSYVIGEVFSKNRIAVNSILSTISPPQQFNNLFTQVRVEESIEYVGYKKVAVKAIDPANSQRTILIFDSANQSAKISDVGGIVISALNKLNFEESTFEGYDGYKYYVGLLREVNRIVYGDPKDSVTYPGVAAAGAEIFIKRALIRRITVSINVRVNTGIPFARITDQVRNNVYALINSTPMGTSIAISDVIASVNNIPGTRAVSITFPEFTPQNDLIIINPAEKPLILDIINDITVSKVG